VLAVLLVAVASGCGPWEPQGIFAGGPFAGRTVQPFPADGSFRDAHPLIAIETRAFLRKYVGIEAEHARTPALRGTDVRRIAGAPRAALWVYRLDDPAPSAQRGISSGSSGAQGEPLMCEPPSTNSVLPVT
jgi:hypothetical protein